MEVFKSGAEEMDEYQKLIIHMNDMPSIVIDNSTSPTATIIKLDSARKHGILLDTVQLLADLNLSITKAYISSDGRWLMNVFHVTDQLGHKITDNTVISCIQQSLGKPASPRGWDSPTVLELAGPDRPGLVSEVFAVLADLHCSVAEAKVWTHKGRLASIISLSGREDPERISRILGHVVCGNHKDDGVARAYLASTVGVVRADRQLHQMMQASLGYQGGSSETEKSVSLHDWAERGYSVVDVQCQDRPKLLFDVVCTLTQMGFIVFHGTIDTKDNRASQEFYIKRSDGKPISSASERERLVQSLQAAIERRSSEGLRLELSTGNHPTLLADITRTFRECGLLVRRAEVAVTGETASCFFYLTGATGCSPDEEAIDAVVKRIGKGCIKLKNQLQRSPGCEKAVGHRQEGLNHGARLWHLGSLIVRNLYNQGLLRFCS